MVLDDLFFPNNTTTHMEVLIYAVQIKICADISWGMAIYTPVNVQSGPCRTGERIVSKDNLEVYP